MRTHIWTILAILTTVLAASGLYLATTDVSQPVGIVVPHHDMVAPARAAYMAKVAQKWQPETIIIISTDHFNTNAESIVAADKVWTTQHGDLETNSSLLNRLKIPVDTNSFGGEHGITTLLNNTKEFFPESQIIAIKMNRSATFSEVESFVNTLYQECATCLFMASVDFSHSVTAEIADLHDTLTLRELERVNPVTLYKNAETDSPETLAALALWADKHQAHRFSLFTHTNSGFIAKRSVGEITSHIIGGYYKGKKSTTEANTLTLLVAGDTMFARGVTTGSLDPFAKLGDRFFWGTDIALLNLEGVFFEETSKAGWYELPPVFRFDPKYVQSLAKQRITHVALDNNHSFDGGDAGIAFTMKTLRGQGITPVGQPEQADGVALYEQGETKLAIIAEGTHATTKDLAPLIMQYTNEGRRVVIYAHWGLEYQNVHSAAQEEQAKHWIDAGADLIIGSHPHVFQDVGVYKGVPIIYSLGNFLFDQKQSVETQIGAVLGARFDLEGIVLFLTPIKSYLTPEVLPEAQSSLLVKQWTEPWLVYQTSRSHFYFPSTVN